MYLQPLVTSSNLKPESEFWLAGLSTRVTEFSACVPVGETGETGALSLTSGFGSVVKM